MTATGADDVSILTGGGYVVTLLAALTAGRVADRFGTAVAFAVVLVLLQRFIMPESAKWLADRGVHVPSAVGPHIPEVVVSRYSDRFKAPYLSRTLLTSTALFRFSRSPRLSDCWLVRSSGGIPSVSVKMRTTASPPSPAPCWAAIPVILPIPT